MKMNGDGISREELYSRAHTQLYVCLTSKTCFSAIYLVLFRFPAFPPRFTYEPVGIVAYRIMARYNVGLGEHPSKYRGEGKAYSMLEDECV